MPATPQDRLYGLTTSVAVKPPVFISADYDVTRFGEQVITSSTPTGDRTVATTEGMRILLMGQDNPVENGIWVARRSFWVRAPDFNGPRDAVNGTLVFSITGDCWQVEAGDPVVIGMSAIHFRPTYPFEANLDIFQRTLRVPEASVSVLPSAEDRAWKGLGFDGAGQPKLQDPAGTGLWGYVPAIGSFEKGSLLTQRFEVLLWESTDEYWRWDGAMPKIVLPGSTPATAGGTGKGKWIDVTDATLRANLGSSEEGLGSALSMHHDGKTVAEHIDGYLDLKRNVTTLKALKITTDGSTDQTEAFQAVLNSFATQDEYWCIDGNGQTLVISDMLTIDVARVGLRNIDIHHTVETSSTAVYAMKIDGSAFSDRRSKGRFAKWEGVRLYGAVNRNKSNVHGVLIEASNSIAQVVLQDIDVQRFNCGLVFASNTYLTIIRNWVIHNCHICWATTAYTTYLATGVMGANLTNAGENIRFIDCLFSDSDILMRPYGIEAFVHFLNTSFDYSGSTVDTSLVQAEGFRQGTSLFFTGCHFESGNAYDNWTGIFFKVNTSVAVFIAFSTFRASNTYNAAPYFFYDEGTYGQFSIEDCNIWGQGVIWWSNRGLTKFYPMINVQSSAVRGYISEKSDLISDPDFSLSSGSNLVDNWHVVDGTRTAAVVSDVLSCAVVSHTDGAGNTYSALKITKLKASAGATLRLYVKAPRTDFAPLGHVSMCADSVITPAGVVSVAVGLAKTKGLLDAYGMPALSLVVPKLSMTVTSVGTTMTRVNARGVLTKSDENNGYDLMFLSVNLGGLAANDVVYITGVNIETPKRA